MSRTTSRIIGTLAATLVVSALVPGSGIAQQDRRSPDQRDAAEASAQTPRWELRSPDSQDAALAARARDDQDRVSSDARDAVGGPSHAPFAGPSGGSTGTEWDDARIVAGAAALGLVLLGLGGGALVMRRRGTVRRSRPPVVSG